jgi:hypothetical protein
MNAVYARLVCAVIALGLFVIAATISARYLTDIAVDQRQTTTTTN